MTGASEKAVQAARVLSEVARDNPDLVREALAPLLAALTPKPDATQLTYEREKTLLKLLCFAHVVFENSRGWTCKYCLDCLAQRCRVSEAQAFIAKHLGKDAERYVLDIAPRLWGEAREAADAVHQTVLAFRVETRRKRNDLI